MKRFLLAASTALLLTACDVGMDPAMDTLDMPEVADGTLSEDTMKRVTERLSSDEFEGRAPGTPGEEKTVAYLIEEFEKAGLEPGNNGSWVQEVPLVEITGKDYAPLTIGGAEGGPIDLEYASDWVGVSYREDVQTTLEDSELVFVGYGINAPEKGWNDYEGLDMAGKTAVILVNDPDFGAETLEGPFNGKAMTYYGRWTYKYEEAARQGAAGVILIHQTAPASYGWNVVSGSWSGTQLDLAREPGEGQFANVESWVTEDRARQMFDLAGLDFDAVTAAAAEPGFTPVEMTGLTASGQLVNSAETMDSRNVVGVVPGTTRPDEYVLYTAHWDHIGIRDVPEGEDGLYNGAVDNATGTAAILEIGEAFAANPAERSVMILAVTAEESGLLGSAYYGENPIVPFDQTVGGLNIDAILPTGRARDVVVVGHGASELEDILTEAAAEQDRYIVPDPNPEAGYFYRSDHIELAKQGVPMLYADGGFDLREGGREAGEAIGEDYRANRYHGPADEYSEDWNMEGMVEDTTLFFTVGSRLANSDAWPNWYEGNEFRALRDAQRSE